MNTQKRHAITLLDNPIVIFFLMLPYFKPTSLEYIAPRWEIFFDIIKVVSFIIILSLYICNYKLSKFIIAIILYELLLLLSTIFNNGDYWKLSVSCGSVIGFCMLTEISLKQNCKLYFKCIFILSFILVITNFILLIIYPEGVALRYGARVNFIATDNSLPPFLIPMMAIAYIYSSFQNKRLTFISFVLIAVISATILITWSATGVVGWFIVLVYGLFIYKSKLSHFLNSKLLYIAFLTLQICLVFLRLQNYFSFIIEDILGKSITFTGRTELWDLSYVLIKRKPIIGYGVYENSGLLFRNGWYYYAHNAVLEIMLQGGILALTAFFVVFLISAIPLYKYRFHYISGIVSITIFSMLIMMLMEAYISHIMLYGLLTVAACIPNIIEQLDKNNEIHVCKHTRKNLYNLNNFKVKKILDK